MTKKVRIHISLKNGVLDPQAKAISHALDSLGFTGIRGVRMIKTIELDLCESGDLTESSDLGKSSGEVALKKAREMSETLLANPVIEDYEIELL